MSSRQRVEWQGSHKKRLLYDAKMVFPTQQLEEKLMGIWLQQEYKNCLCYQEAQTTQNKEETGKNTQQLLII